MAKNLGTELDLFYLCTSTKEESFWGSIRHWENVSIAYEGDNSWLKGLTLTQTQSVEVMSLLHKQLFAQIEGKLFKIGSLLPERNIPDLEWIPLKKAVSIELPSFNFNFFYLPEKVRFDLVQATQLRESIAMLVDLSVLKDYVETAPALRLSVLKWVILGSQHAFLLGTPLLPIQGLSFWQKGRCFFPDGLQPEFPILLPTLEQKLGSNLLDHLVFNPNGQILTVSAYQFKQLSRSSFRLSYEKILTSH